MAEAQATLSALPAQQWQTVLLAALQSRLLALRNAIDRAPARFREDDTALAGLMGHIAALENRKT